MREAQPVSNDTTFLVALAIAVVVLVSRLWSRRLDLPDPVLLVVLGLVASFVPDVPSVQLSPDVVFLFFLPPLVYHAGFFTAPRETRAYAIPIGVAAVALVLVTTAGVAAASHFVLPGLGWAAAFVLGAVVAPTDPVAATSVMRRLGAPTRMTVILEGESTANDGVALTVLGISLSAVSGHFSIGQGILQFVYVAAGGIAYGVVVGWVAGKFRQYVHDSNAQILISLVVPYVAYVPASRLGLSGVLATMAAGFYLGTREGGVFHSSSRLASNAFWNVFTFLLESTLFVLLGLQFRQLLAGISGIVPGRVAVLVSVVVFATVGIRLAWQLGVPPLLRAVGAGGRLFGGIPWRERLVMGWSGVRGAISLAAALSIPVVSGGKAFPYRSLVIFATIIVVLVTLVLQATTLSGLLGMLGVAELGWERGESLKARKAAAESALRRLDELASGLDERTVRVLRQEYEIALDQMEADSGEGEGGEAEPASLRLELVAAQRACVNDLYRRGEIGIRALRELARELDLEEARLRSEGARD